MNEKSIEQAAHEMRTGTLTAPPMPPDVVAEEADRIAMEYLQESYWLANDT